MNYWTGRENMNYYAKARELADEFCPEGRTLLDVGGAVLAGAKYLTRFERFNRTSVELSNGESTLPGVTVYRQNFLDWTPPRHLFDLVLCLQVLEHLKDEVIPQFTEKLLGVGKVLIVSVPHVWPAAAEAGHLQDPINVEKFRGWWPSDPATLELVSECGKKLKRLIAVFIC